GRANRRVTVGECCVQWLTQGRLVMTTMDIDAKLPSFHMQRRTNVARTSVGKKERSDSPDAARRSFSLGLGLLPMFPMLPGCSAGMGEGDQSSATPSPPAQ